MPTKIECALLETELSRVPARCRKLEELGYDGTFTFEGPHEPFLPLLLAAEHAPKLEIGTGVAIALARNPMVTAQLAYELQKVSKGRFVLGLGSQVRAHVERRYSMPYDRPVARMKEFVLALRAIFGAFEGEGRLAFEGEFYRHTLLPPLFNPGKNPFGPPRIHLAGVNEQMVRVVAEVADGLIVHPFHTKRFLEEVTLPAVEVGKQRRLHAVAPFEIAVQALVVMGETEEELEQARAATRAQIAFYASTPSYRAVLESEGYGELQEELQALTRQGRWGEMAACIDDTLFERVAYVGTPEEVAEELHDRLAGFAARIAIATPFHIGDPCSARMISRYRAIEAGQSR